MKCSVFELLNLFTIFLKYPLSQSVRPQVCKCTMDELVTLERIELARSVLKQSNMVVRTPMICKAQSLFELQELENPKFNLYLKLENMQRTGSFKVRGVANQFALLPEAIKSGKEGLISMSAGNYGKAFAHVTNKLGIPGMLCMPETAPADRAKLIRNLGVKVETVPTSEITRTVSRYVSNSGMYFLHPFDDLDLIAGCASAGLEILEDVPSPDIVVICCGGGGLLSGVASAIKLSGHKNTRVIGVEPEGAPSMYLSTQKGHAVTLESVNTIAAGLAPPYAGKHTFRHVQEFVEKIVLVSDDEIKRAVRTLYKSGLVVEPSGAAAFAAVQSNKIGNIEGCHVVVVITGGNVTPEELSTIISQAS